MDRIVVGILLVAACSADTDNVGSVQEAYCNCNSNPVPCCCETPIVLDIAGDGLELTTWREGVVFALRPSRPIGPWAWTHQGSDDAWLVLDNDDGGVITNGTELFWRIHRAAKDPDGEERNGFLALAQYDSNGDRVVDEQDNVLDELRRWQDKDHDGISQPEKPHVLPELGVAGPSVDYASIREPDGQGNVPRYSASVHVTPGSSVGMTAWDVMLTSPDASEWNYGAPPTEEPPEGGDDRHREYRSRAGVCQRGGER